MGTEKDETDELSSVRELDARYANIIMILKEMNGESEFLYGENLKNSIRENNEMVCELCETVMKELEGLDGSVTALCAEASHGDRAKDSNETVRKDIDRKLEELEKSIVSYAEAASCDLNCVRIAIGQSKGIS